MSRILTLQRQARELGRLRLGYVVPTGSNGKSRPVASKTWVLTSHSEDYIRAAAALWGGDVESWQPQGNGAAQWRVITNAEVLDAIMPPGDPLSQHFELWNRGGCARRCDGQTESLSDSPCLCRAQFGDDFHQQKAGTVCDIVSRLNVMLPDLPDIGVWRMDSGSYYAANEVAAQVDIIRGALGDRAMVPVRIRITPRTRTAGGETKQFVVPVIELRGITAGELLSGGGALAAIGSAGPKAVAAPTVELPDYVAQITGCGSTDDLRALWGVIRDAGHMTEALANLLSLRAEELKPVDATIDDDVDTAWNALVTEAGLHDMTMSDLEGLLRKEYGDVELGAAQYVQFAHMLKTGEVAA